MNLVNNDKQLKEEKDKKNKSAQDESSNEAQITALLRLNKILFEELDALKLKVSALKLKVSALEGGV